MILRTMPFILPLALLTGCQSGTDQNMTAREATEIANSALAEVLPQLPLNRLTIETADLDEKWRVTYRPPEGSTGGPLVIDVNKQSDAATIVSMEQ